MIVDLSKFAKECSCGHKHTITVKDIWIEENAVSHLENILIPNPPEILKKEIHNLIVKSYDLRDESNNLIDEAEKLLIEELKLPPIEDFKPEYFDKEKE